MEPKKADKVVVLTGAGSGLGLAIYGELLKQTDKKVIRILPEMDSITGLHIGTGRIGCDLFDPEAIIFAAGQILDAYPYIYAIINCAGWNCINWMQDYQVQEWDYAMRVNAHAPVLLTEGLLPGLINAKGAVLNILSDAAERPMTASLVYNASKAAARMATLQMARELGRVYDLTVFGISPAKISGTAMTNYVDTVVPSVRGWTPEYAEEYHRKSVLMKTDIDVNVLAHFVAYLLSSRERHCWLNGCIMPYGG